MTTPTKLCHGCKRQLDVQQFCRNRREPDGLSRYCRECASVRAKTWRQSHLAELKAYHARWHADRKAAAKMNEADAHEQQIRLLDQIELLIGMARTHLHLGYGPSELAKNQMFVYTTIALKFERLAELDPANEAYRRALASAEEAARDEERRLHVAGYLARSKSDEVGGG